MDTVCTIKQVGVAVVTGPQPHDCQQTEHNEPERWFPPKEILGELRGLIFPQGCLDIGCGGWRQRVYWWHLNRRVPYPQRWLSFAIFVVPYHGCSILFFKSYKGTAQTDVTLE